MSTETDDYPLLHFQETFISKKPKCRGCIQNFTKGNSSMRIGQVHLTDINVSAGIDEYPSLCFQDIRKNKIHV